MSTGHTPFPRGLPPVQQHRVAITAAVGDVCARGYALRLRHHVPDCHPNHSRKSCGEAGQEGPPAHRRPQIALRVLRPRPPWRPYHRASVLSLNHGRRHARGPALHCQHGPDRHLNHGHQCHGGAGQERTLTRRRPCITLRVLRPHLTRQLHHPVSILPLTHWCQHLPHRWGRLFGAGFRAQATASSPAACRNPAMSVVLLHAAPTQC